MKYEIWKEKEIITLLLVLMKKDYGINDKIVGKTIRHKKLFSKKSKCRILVYFFKSNF